MLYIFQVDSGCMMTFDMDLAVETVNQLKEAIDRLKGIPAEKQVLLVSGGECLDPCSRVCSYSAGTDTNPIYLFSKLTLENSSPPTGNIDFGSDTELKDEVDSSLNMPATYSTVVTRARLAQRLYELGKEQTRACENLVHEQHLQHQGWAAAVCNLEDVTTAFTNRRDLFDQAYLQHLETRMENLDILQNFHQDLQTLHNIPILPPLLETAWSSSTSDVSKDNSEEQQELGTMTLLQWISAADNKSSLETVATLCSNGLQQLDEITFEALKREISEALDAACKNDMKEIKGLGERLYGLEQLMCETKKILQEQNDLALAFQQNLNRAGNLGDASILPDLCASHRRQLILMLSNQSKLKDIRRRCFRAKEELSINLYHRLGWVIYVENKMGDVSNKLMIYHENLKRLRRYLEIIKQVQRAPQIYVSAVGEVVRRRKFSQAYLTWASELSCLLLAICNEETDRRKEFALQFDGHFLKTLFPGLDDIPPTFATQAPPPFDTLLPKLTMSDLEMLESCGGIPNLKLDPFLTKLSSLAQMFLTKSTDSKEGIPVEEGLVAAVSEIGLGSKLDTTLLQPEPDFKNKNYPKDDKDFESETDTEEFEKVCQSPVDLTFEAKQKSELSTSRRELEKLRGYLLAAGRLASEAAGHLKSELGDIKSQSLNDREMILDLVKDIQVHVIQLTNEFCTESDNLHKRLLDEEETHQQETVKLKEVIEEKQRIIEVLQEEINEFRNLLNIIKEENRDLILNNYSFEKSIEDMRNQLEKKEEELSLAIDRLKEEHRTEVERLQTQINEAKESKEKALEEITQKLTHDFNNSIEELNSKLVRLELDAEVEREKTIENLTKEYITQMEELKNKCVTEAEMEKQKVVKEVTDKLMAEHKTEFENLRARFKLMSSASMEKSPSDSSLEKIERYDVIELTNHESIIIQLKDNMKLEKEEALKLMEENCKKKIETELEIGRQRMEEEKQIWLQEAVSRALIEKDKQIENLLIKQKNLLTDNQRHRDTIRFLTETEQIRSGGSPGAGTVDPLLERIDELQKEKNSLQMEVETLRRTEEPKTRHDDMTSSVAVCTATEILKDAATSPELTKRSETKMTRSTTTLAQGKISINTCSAGDAVLVIWDTEHANYTILQESTSTYYFLHSDCLDVLGLRPSSDGSPRKLCSTAIVVEKEYCHAKKSENRYRVPKGTKFYRVKVKPLCKELKESSLSRSHHRHQAHCSGEFTRSQPEHHPCEIHQEEHLRLSLDSGLTTSQVSNITEER